MAGPAWKGIRLSPSSGQTGTFEAETGAIHYALRYRPAADHLIVECILSNRGKEIFEPEYSRLFIGIDSEMKTFPEWDTKFFPTLLRCEKDFTWGYFMSPRQVIMGIGIEEPVASYALNYVYELSLIHI